jgi:hypothetical protein
MPGRFDQDDEYPEWEEDPEGPQERDLAGEDEDETPTVPCPSCGVAIPDFADKCPYCGDWVVQGSGAPSHRRGWIVVVAILLVIALAAVYVW